MKRSPLIKRKVNCIVTIVIVLLTTSAFGQSDPVWTMEELGHSNWVTAEVFSPDGVYYVTGSIDQTILIRIAATGQEVERLVGHSGTITSLAFSPDGNLIASASSDETIRLWNPSTGLEVGRITGHSAEVTSVAFSPDGTQLVSGSVDTTIRLWNVDNQQEIARFNGHSGAVNSVSFSPNGSRLASGSADQTVRVWIISTRQQERMLTGHTDAVTSVAFSPSSTLPLLASGSDDHTIRLWELITGTEVLGGPLTFHEGPVRDILFSYNGRLMVSVSENRVFSLTRFGNFGRLTIRSVSASGGGPFTSVSISPDAEIATFGSGNQLENGQKVGTSFLFDVSEFLSDNPFTAERYIAPTLFTYSVSFSSDGSMFVSGSWDGTLRLTSTESGDVIRRFKTGSVLPIIAVALSPDGTRLVSGSIDEENSLRIWDTNSLGIIDSLSDASQIISSVAFSPDGNQFATGSNDGLVQLRNTESGEVQVEFSGHTDQINSIAFSPDGNLLASGSRDRTVRLWDLANQNELNTFSGHLAGVSSVVFSPSGDILVSGSFDGRIRVWNLTSGQIVRQITGHSSQVTSVDVSQDGNEIISGSYDTTIRVWNTSTGEELRRFEHSRQVFSLDLSNDDRFIVSAGQNSVKLWDQDNLLSFASGVKDQTYIRGQDITPLALPEVVGGITPITYTLSPTLPDGLIFNQSFRQLTGKPTALTSPELFTYTATDSKGFTAQLNFRIHIIAPVSNEHQDLPESFRIVGNYPNPFHESTNLLLDLPRSTTVHVDMMDVIGRRVLTTPPTNLPGGWNRSIEINGEFLPAGIYLYRLTETSSLGTSVHSGQFVRIR